ncbi:MAG TPA: glutamine amidotransferase [Planctomycetota bacterium]|jgi:uncharacterized membrane protein
MNQIPFLLGTPWPWWSILCAGAGAGWLTWRGYQRRSGEVKAQRLKILNWLRMSGWFLLFLCLLQPIHRQFMREEKASRLTVLVDDSESMSFVDARSGPRRIDQVKKVLLGEKSDVPKPARGALLDVLGRSFNVQLESFGQNSRPIASLSELDAGGASTDIGKALGEAFSRLRGPDAGGLVLISDGADTAGGDLARVAAAFKRAGTPVYTIGVGKAEMADLAITQVRCRRVVSKDTLVRVEVDVLGTGLPDGKHNVSITRQGKTVGAPVAMQIKNGAGTARFEFLPESQGFLEYEAHVEPFLGELVTANNTMAFGVVAYSRKLKVLYMEGSMYVHRIYESATLSYGHPMQSWWEHQFTERAILEDSDIELTMLAKDEFKTPPGAEPLDLKTVKQGYPKTKKELYEYDVIICADIPYHFFNEDQVKWTVDFVAKHGGGFMMVGGYDSFAEGKYPKTPIDRMLPVEMLNEDHVNARDFHWKLTDEAWSHPIMQMDKDDEKNKEIWSKLPIFHGFSKTTRVKPAATLLAVVAEEEFETGYGPAILLAVQPFGNGRSMAFTSDTTGSWGTEWEDSWGVPNGEENERNKYFKQFWKNTIRWLAHYRMQAPNQLVTIETDRLVYGRGEEPEIRIKVMNEDYDLTHDAEVRVSITGPEGRQQFITIFPRYEEPGIYERKLELGGVGKYEIEAVARLKKDELGRDKAILQVRPATAEMRQLSQNEKLLKKLAQDTGGTYLPIERAAELPQHLREATHVIEKHRDNDLWDKSWVFALAIGLFCTEWFLRKRSGLP